MRIQTPADLEKETAPPVGILSKQVEIARRTRPQSSAPLHTRRIALYRTRSRYPLMFK